jgi:hypothetical protein
VFGFPHILFILALTCVQVFAGPVQELSDQYQAQLETLEKGVDEKRAKLNIQAKQWLLTVRNKLVKQGDLDGIIFVDKVLKELDEGKDLPLATKPPTRAVHQIFSNYNGYANRLDKARIQGRGELLTGYAKKAEILTTTLLRRDDVKNAIEANAFADKLKEELAAVRKIFAAAYPRPPSKSSFKKLTAGDPLKQELVLFYSFSHGKAQLRDEAGNDYAGDLNGSCTITANMKGRKGVLEMSRPNAYIHLGNQGLGISTEVSMFAWVQMDKYPTGTDFGTILTKSRAHYFQVDTKGRLAVYHYGARKAGYHLSNESIPLSTWTHAGYTWNGKVLKLYINGVEDRSLQVTGSIVPGSAPLSIGCNLLSPKRTTGKGGRQLVGALDDITVYRKALTPADVTRLFESQKNE